MQKNTSFIDTSSTNFSSGRKINDSQQAIIWKMAAENPDWPTSKILNIVKQEQGNTLDITIRQINRYRRQWGVNRKSGRPRKREEKKNSNEIICVKPNISHVGIHLFNDWLDQQKVVSGVIVLIKKAIQEYRNGCPEVFFPLLNHRDETLERRFKALLYAPLFEIGKLTEYDVKRNGLSTVIGRGYQSSTLIQFLCQLEQVDAGKFLMPALLNDDCGDICYIDGHMIPFWTKASMHKGKITMLGRIMPGSNAVTAHNEKGEALYVDYISPDIRLPKIILEYCKKVVVQTGIKLFVIDREVNSKAMASAFEQEGWGLISMLDNNEFKDLSDWDIHTVTNLDDESILHIGQWKDKEKGDTRKFAVVDKKGKLLPYWGNPSADRMLPPDNWPRIYSLRTEIQENSFRRMIAHGALNINYGIKKIETTDRHQERKLAALEEKMTKLDKKTAKKQHAHQCQSDKVLESIKKKHSKRLEQRQRKLGKIEQELKDIEKKKEKLNNAKDNLGEPKKRFDRDFKKQVIMTFRTLLLENLLLSFLTAMLKDSDITLSIGKLIAILFKRDGGYFETTNEIVYWVNSSGMSKAYKQLLAEIVERLNSMVLCRNEKKICIKIREAPT